MHILDYFSESEEAKGVQQRWNMSKPLNMVSEPTLACAVG